MEYYWQGNARHSRSSLPLVIQELWCHYGYFLMLSVRGIRIDVSLTWASHVRPLLMWFPGKLCWAKVTATKPASCLYLQNKEGLNAAKVTATKPTSCLYLQKIEGLNPCQYKGFKIQLVAKTRDYLFFMPSTRQCSCDQNFMSHFAVLSG